MAIITVSRGSYSKGKEVAEKVAQRLGYSCISRDLLVEASEQFNIPEIKLIRALHDAPSILERFTYGREQYLAYFAAALLERVQKDNVVYHGLAGHFYLKGITHVLKVRILADLEDRVRLEMAREGISREEALYILKKDDHERRQWSLKLFGVDTWDPSLYDLVIHISKISVDDAVAIICHTVGLEHFKTTLESQKALNDLALAAHVRAALVKGYPNAKVRARDGSVEVSIGGDLKSSHHLAVEVKALAEKVPGVQRAGVSFGSTGLFQD
jgi:cytidylate kinase